MKLLNKKSHHSSGLAVSTSNFRLMKNRILKFCFLAFVAIGTMSLITSCSDTEENLVNVDNFVGEAVFGLRAEGKIGARGCYEFVFPITINFPDETSVSVDDYDALRSTIRTWKEDNPEAEERPTLGYPIELMTEEGELVSVNSKEELKELRRACRRAHFDGRWRPGRFFKRACFEPVFPISVEFPNGSVLEAGTPDELKSAIREWYQAQDGPIDEKPSVVYPITVEFEDGSQVEVGSREELVALKDECDTED